LSNLLHLQLPILKPLSYRLVASHM